MTIQLPEDLARYVQNEVVSGHFASEQEAITEAVRVLRQRQQQTAVQGKPLYRGRAGTPAGGIGLLGKPTSAAVGDRLAARISAHCYPG